MNRYLIPGDTALYMDKHGQFVRYVDYEALEQERDRLREALDSEAGKLERSAQNLRVATASPSPGPLADTFDALAKRMHQALAGGDGGDYKP